MGELIERSQPENNIPQPSIEHTTPCQPIVNNEGDIWYRVRKYIKNTKNKTGFFKQNEDQERGRIGNGYPIKKLGGTETEINSKKFKTIPGIRKVTVDSSWKTAKSMNDMDKVVFRDILQTTT